MNSIAGRWKEQERLKGLLVSEKSEFVAIYGRRRIGKTFLIRKSYEKELVFQTTGLANATMDQQLVNFFNDLKTVHTKFEKTKTPKNWFEAFELLKAYLTERKNKKKVIFIDELPWYDTAKSNFLSSLEHFWNSWASTRTDIVLVVCGSAASWIINKLINNKGGLHNRVTQRIRLLPFTLEETEAYFKLRKIQLDRYQIIQIYMVFGGIPFYLDEVKPGMSAFQVIDKVCFSQDGILVDEYQKLYHSLFNSAERHIAVIEALASKKKGLTRDELLTKSGLGNGGTTTAIFEELEESGFISKYYPFEKKQKNSLYRLSDQYSLFYLKFIKNSKSTGEGTWMTRIDNPTWRAWSGYAYENIWMDHIDYLKKGLGINGVYTEASSWIDSEKKVQIDLLLDRRDQVISICEVKFSMHPFQITKQYKTELQNKLSVFKQAVKTRKSLFLTMITTFGLDENIHSTGLVQNVLTLDDLF
jgi:AAA+ ATPase superfamily predicted ATPase